MLTRRRWGLALIAAVVLLVTVIAQGRPRVVGGSAQATPVPGPPAVGDCVLDPYPSQPVLPVMDAASAGGAVPVYPAQTIGPCTGDRYGEVVAVFPHPRPYQVKGDGSSGRYPQDPNVQDCTSLVSAYVGLVDAPMFGFWASGLSVDVGMSKPSTRQTAAGHRWAACVVTVQPENVPADPLTGPPYARTLRNAMHTGAERNLLGRCSPTLDWDLPAATGSCALPHVLEVLGYASTGARSVSRTELAFSCRRLADALTGMPDSTAAGELGVQVHVVDGDNAVLSSAIVPVDSYATCGIVVLDGRTLTGSLLVLGRGPVPWA